MRAVVQRVTKGRVTVENEVVGDIGPGLVVLLGVGREDTIEDARYLAEKIARLRIFEDPEGKMNVSVLDTGGAVLAVSQFTLMGDCRKGRRPSFSEAAAASPAERLYEDFVASLREAGVPVNTGRFQTTMLVEIHNHGPVTMLLDSKKVF
ncbi:D-aminoacyl-tRNA deacylase [Phosphitispora fastidiosa]|uniref:D-aminoacyl-tRNA deacylase n=1 Tax=Phosphitispora fastidiosa TaxID=2837202 RepID=UPI001E2ACDBE|nr:D-tyrosyl-tRNA(Tyr) deacylase [Phosphitispora fastidiosa]